MLDARNLHIDTALTNVSIAFKNQALIAELLLPVINVKKMSDIYWIYGKEAFKIHDTYRRDGTESNEVGFTLSQGTYTVEDHALKEIVTDRQRDNADAPLKPDVDTTEFLTDCIALKQEKLAADLLINSTNLSTGTTLSGTSQWNDYNVRNNQWQRQHK